MLAPRRARRKYKPGDTAPVSGIYRITHQGHRSVHEALVLRGEELPPCRTCRGEVFFEVLRMVSHVTHDFDFAGPGQIIVRRSGPDSESLPSSG